MKVGDKVLYRGHEVEVLQVDGVSGRAVAIYDPRRPQVKANRCGDGLTCFEVTPERRVAHARLAESVEGLCGLHLDVTAIQRLVWTTALEHGDEHALAIAAWLDSVRSMLLGLASGEGVHLFEQTSPL